MSDKAKYLNRPVHRGGHAKGGKPGWVTVRVCGRANSGQPNFCITIPALLAQRVLRTPAMFYKASLDKEGRIIFTPTKRVPDG